LRYDRVAALGLTARIVVEPTSPYPKIGSGSNEA
jgi:hypothetical protein